MLKGKIDTAVDSAVAVATAVGLVVGSLLVARVGPQRPLDSVGGLLLVAGAAALAWRRRYPVGVALAAGTTSVAYYGLLYPGIFASAPVLLAVYTVVSLGRRLEGVVVAVVYAAALYLVIAVPRGSYEVHDGVLWNAGFLVASVVIGAMAATQRAYLAAVEQRAAEAERTREEAALRRASEERLWIAQELHDTITHSISVINVQAGVAAHLMERDPTQAKDGLMAIKETSQDVMCELRATLGVLRQADDGGKPGIDRIPILVERAQRAGLQAVLDRQGEPRPLSEAADRAAYRIVQEALTNALRHSPQAAVTVCLTYQPDTLALRVADDGEAAHPSPGSGMGLIGMRERAIAAGGSLTAGPRPGGGFLIEGVLPVHEEPRA
ncbi:sensor histidine kinase [Actinomadura sp. ATCC 39365]